MKVRLHHNFSAEDKTLTLILDRDGETNVVVDQWDFEKDLTRKDLELIGRFTTGMNIALTKMWH